MNEAHVINGAQQYLLTTEYIQSAK